MKTWKKVAIVGVIAGAVATGTLAATGYIKIPPFEKSSNPGTGPGGGSSGPPEFIYSRPQIQYPGTAKVPNLF